MRKGRKRQFNKQLLKYALLGAALISLMTVLGVGAFFKVSSIVVSGGVVYTSEQIVEASGVSRGDGLLFFNTQSVSDKISAALPYAQGVTIYRKFPDTLIIEIEESKPIAYISFDGNTLIVDSGGRILEIRPGASNAAQLVKAGEVKMIEVRGVAVVEAAEGRQPRIEAGLETGFQTMNELLTAIERENLAADIDYIDISGVTNIHLGYQNTYRVILGGIRELRYKLSILPITISNFQDRFPNTRGVLNMTSPLGAYTFTPE
ncbi:MAG: FtsQ-type POTRA domain-containing protein [Oscillospiraceae bacterium]|nr:FtsQ-type POTRA domain-containing protein [Oscillospiraceae bacterium]